MRWKKSVSWIEIEDSLPIWQLDLNCLWRDDTEVLQKCKQTTLQAHVSFRFQVYLAIPFWGYTIKHKLWAILRIFNLILAIFSIISA